MYAGPMHFTRSMRKGQIFGQTNMITIPTIKNISPIQLAWGYANIKSLPYIYAITGSTKNRWQCKSKLISTPCHMMQKPAHQTLHKLSSDLCKHHTTIKTKHICNHAPLLPHLKTKICLTLTVYKNHKLKENKKRRPYTRGGFIQYWNLQTSAS